MAELDCESDGGHLVVIDDEAENLWLSSVAASQVEEQLIWTGLVDQLVEGDFRWITAAPVGLERWDAMEPNSLYDGEDCVEVRATGLWNDDHCDRELSYVCECDGASAAGNWCDTFATATCGDCSTTCPAEQTCVDQLCE